MSNKMLIDATHPEETRVVVLRNKRVEDFDFEAASRRPLRGNIYLAKVTRVEPSLQAAFIEYGGNRHGFLAFSEIHPDYYQIPQADRQALIDELEEEAEEEPKPKPKRTSRRSTKSAKKSADPAEASAPDDERDAEETAAPGADGDTDVDAESGADAEQTAAGDDAATDIGTDTDKLKPEEAIAASADDDAPGETSAAAEPPSASADPDTQSPSAEAAPAEPSAIADAEAKPAAAEEDAPPEKPKRRRRASTKKSDDGLEAPVITDDEPADDDTAEGDDVTSIGSSDAMEEVPERKRRQSRRHYKIQEVIKRRQILLVQVVKEERGNKGAALTTYLSLAGRYSVLMPNTSRGGGVSRKITDNADRKRLKSLVAELDIPKGMGIILRTAGAARTKSEIKRDYEYLLRLWESVRDLTLKSIAPQLVYEEGNLVKRAIRDLYSKEIDEVLVSGDTAYREAKDFMKMLMPSHAKNVKAYREATPIFSAYAVEPQLDSMFSPMVTLPAKGSIVINPTEALVAIDVNSGKSNRESNIEDTATKTNLEAADEVARQLRLRDLAGLIVIDFIDMDDKRHIRQVEKRLKDALKMDRSRIQVGRISPFGLMEMSRQRIRQGMVETSMVCCPTCGGSGQVRSTQSVALHCLRSLEDHLLRDADHHLTIRTSSAVALYILNQKRAHLNDLEERFGLNIGVHADEALAGQLMQIVPGAPVERDPEDEVPTAQIAPDAVGVDDEDDDDDEAIARSDDGERSGRRRRRRRRRGEGDTERNGEDAAFSGGDSADGEADGDTDQDADGDRRDATAGDDRDDGEDGKRRSRRRRGRRGGRRHRREDEDVEGETTAGAPLAAAEGDALAVTDGAGATHSADQPGRDGDAQPIARAIDIEVPGAGDANGDAIAIEAPEPAEVLSPSVPETGTRAPDGDDERDEAPVAASADITEPEPASATAADEEAKPEEDAAEPEAAPEPRPRRVGWWQRKSFF